MTRLTDLDETDEQEWDAAPPPTRHVFPCGCTYGWAHGDGQCSQGVTLYAEVCTARAAYHAEPYYTRAELLYQHWLEAERAFGAHFNHAPAQAAP